MAKAGVVRVAVMGVFVAVMLSAGPAFAGEAELVDREVQTVSGVEVAREIVSGITDVQLGSDGATVTMEIDGEQREMSVGLGGEDGGVSTGGIFGIAALSGAAVTALKFMGKIAHLFH